MADVDKYISPYQYCENPAGEIEEILSSVGFSKYKIHISDKNYVYEGIDSLKSESRLMQNVSQFKARSNTTMVFLFFLQRLSKLSIHSVNGCHWTCKRIF